MATPITCTIREACKASGLGETKLYEAIKNKELSRIKVGRRTLVRYDQLKAWLESKAA
ncbi:excisionase family DNA-binding protein [Tardiphaga sp. 42S5]|uniref:excisionase family DNA-binding protein n=1 Tax=Tardiphaga sp. 42S5 TaxID=1404799 RepID=UPI0039C948D1